MVSATSEKTALLIVAAIVVAVLLTIGADEAIGGEGRRVVTKTVSGWLDTISDEVQRQRFIFSLPEEGKPYAEDILRAAADEGVSPYVLAAIAERETSFGTASALDQPGPEGRGDFSNGEWHGHGLMQIDNRSHQRFIDSGRWKIPYDNLREGARVWKLGRRQLGGSEAIVAGDGTIVADGRFVRIGSTSAARLSRLAGKVIAPGSYPDPRPIAGDDLDRAATAAYNAGVGGVVRAVAAGLDPDLVTTGSRRSGGVGDYAADVARRFENLIARAEAAAVSVDSGLA